MRRYVHVNALTAQATNCMNNIIWIMAKRGIQQRTPCCSLKSHGTATKLILLDYTARKINYVHSRHCGEHMRLPDEVLTSRCSTFMVGVIQAVLNVAWMVVMTLLVVAVLDCCFPVVKNGQKGLSSSMVKFRKHK